jgi:heat shock protein HslJ
MKTKLFLLLLLVVMTLLFVVGCSSSAEEPTAEPAPATTIEGIVWQWVSVANRTTNETTTVPNPENYTLIFNEDGTFNGTADCNNISGTYSQVDGFTVTVTISTNAFCGEESLDQQYLDLLSQVVAGGPDGSGGLALESAGGENRMSFSNGGVAEP